MDPVNIAPIRPRESTTFAICPRRIGNSENAIENTPPAPTAEGDVPADVPPRECCGTLETVKPEDPAKSPLEMIRLFSVHRCPDCEKYFSIDLSDVADPGSLYTKRVVDMAVRYVVEDGSPYRDASWRLWRDHRVFVPFATIQNWVEASGDLPSRH